MFQAKPNYVELPATDLNATKTFYEEKFGWTFIEYGPGYAAANVSGGRGRIERRCHGHRHEPFQLSRW